MVLDDYKNVVSTVGTVVTIGQFLSGIDICRRIVKQGSTGDISGFPFIGGVFSGRCVKEDNNGATGVATNYMLCYIPNMEKPDERLKWMPMLN